MRDIRAATGVLHGVLAGLVIIVLAVVFYAVLEAAMANTHEVYEPEPKEWLVP